MITEPAERLASFPINAPEYETTIPGRFVAIGVSSTTLPAGAVRIPATYTIRSEHNLGYIFTITWRP